MLRTVQHEPALDLLRRRLDGREVRAGVRLGQGDARRDLAAHQRHQVLLALVLRAERVQHLVRAEREVAGEQHRQLVPGASGHLLAHEAHLVLADPGTADVLRHEHRVVAGLDGPALDLPAQVEVLEGHDLVGDELSVLRRKGFHLAGDERPHAVQQLLDVVRDVVVHQRFFPMMRRWIWFVPPPMGPSRESRTSRCITCSFR